MGWDGGHKTWCFLLSLLFFLIFTLCVFHLCSISLVLFSSCLERDGKRQHCAQQIATKETKRRDEGGGDISRRPKKRKNDKSKRI
ncbi:hypothetical protein CKAH01_00548 [Colletotrichum kahawae]|uniref:Uncharacterized protein n=1 Tax=Colletotrichum kahawae TaxID=34407 RepID=A0AAD9YHF7_COLKA|nr:hypothetical protein CKAH01_00548 [Colletotrichum kahawae]